MQLCHQDISFAVALFPILCLETGKNIDLEFFYLWVDFFSRWVKIHGKKHMNI